MCLCIAMYRDKGFSFYAEGVNSLKKKKHIHVYSLGYCKRIHVFTEQKTIATNLVSPNLRTVQDAVFAGWFMWVVTLFWENNSQFNLILLSCSDGLQAHNFLCFLLAQSAAERSECVMLLSAADWVGTKVRMGFCELASLQYVQAHHFCLGKLCVCSHFCIFFSSWQNHKDCHDLGRK